MRRQPRRDTKPEVEVRRLLHAAGLRYRVDARPIKDFRRTADIVFRPAHVAVFLDGCFWHGCPEHSRYETKTNSRFWSDKITKNRERDRETDRVLTEAGWTVVRAWEHEDPVVVAAKVLALLEPKRGFGSERHN